MTCDDCILDLTDACSRGAGRAVDDEICEDFISEKEDYGDSRDREKIRQNIHKSKRV